MSSDTAHVCVYGIYDVGVDCAGSFSGESLGQKWKNINSIVRVNTKADFRDKIDKRYGKIIVYGDLKDEIVNYAVAKQINLAAISLGLIGIFFGPAAVVGGGLALSNMKWAFYQGKEVSGEVVFTHAKYLKKK